jgi:hypothetical protein
MLIHDVIVDTSFTMFVLLSEMSIEILKSAVSRKFGRKPINRPDCEALSLEVFETIQVQLSYNTLRRIFNLADNKKHKTSNHTLNILSKYLGYENFYQFSSVVNSSEFVAYEQEFILRLQLNKAISKTELIEFLNQDLNEQRVNRILPVLILTIFEKKDYKFLTEFFQLEWFLKSRSQLNSDLFYSLQLLGVKIRQINSIKKQKQIWKSWSTQPTARLFYFEFFVDMDFLNISHKYALEAYLQCSKSNEERIFASSLLFWSAFCANDTCKIKVFLPSLIESGLSEEIHPIPLARAINCLLLYYSETKDVSNVNNQLSRVKELILHYSTAEDPFFHYWIIEGLVLIRHYEFCLDIISLIETNWSYNIQKHYHRGSQLKAKIIKCHCQYKLGMRKQSKSNFLDLNFEHNYAFSKIYDQLFLPSKYRGDVDKRAKELGYTKLLELLY